MLLSFASQKHYIVQHAKECKAVQNMVSWYLSIPFEVMSNIIAQNFV